MTPKYNPLAWYYGFACGLLAGIIGDAIGTYLASVW
jgi:hypothetical protein